MEGDLYLPAVLNFAYMKRSERGLVLFVIGAIAIILGSCHFKKDYTAEIKELDSLSTVVDEYHERLSAQGNWTGSVDTIRDLLHTIQALQPEGLSLEQVALLNDMGRIRLEMESIEEVKTQLALKLDSSSSQLKKLQQALKEGATHDSDDNKMDELYVMKALQKERDVVQQLSSRFVELDEANSELLRKHAQWTPQLQLLVDSIAEKHY